MITTPCYFTGFDTTYFCSVFHQIDTIEAHWDIYNLIIEQDSVNGKVIYSATFNPDSLGSDNAQTIENLEIQNNAEGKYLVVYGAFGNGMVTRLFAKPNNKVVEIAQFSPQPPEFVDIDTDGELEILVPQGSVKLDAISYPKVDIYKWDGWRLKLLRTVSYKERLSSH